MKYHSHVITKYGLVIIKHVDSFFSSFKIWNSCCLVVVKESVTFNFNEIHLLAVGEFNELGLREVFEHRLGYMIFKFVSQKHMLKATVSRSLFVECAKPEFEVFFFKQWSEGMYLGTGDNIKVWVQLNNVPFIYWSVKGVCRLASALGNPLDLTSVLWIIWPHLSHVILPLFMLKCRLLNLLLCAF